MAGYSWKVTFEGAGLETGGAIDGQSNDYFFLSPISYITKGFVYQVGDIWAHLYNPYVQDLFWDVTDSGTALETGGLVAAQGNNPGYNFFSSVSLLTNGLVYQDPDVWHNLDEETIQNVTWTLCDCTTRCD